MYIGEAARRCGLSVKTIRFYEAEGLIPAPLRKGHYRRYTEDDLRRLQLLAEARRLGFGLSALRPLMTQAFAPGHCLRVNELIDQQRIGLLQQMRALQEQLDALDRLQHQLQPASQKA